MTVPTRSSVALPASLAGAFDVALLLLSVLLLLLLGCTAPFGSEPISTACLLVYVNWLHFFVVPFSLASLLGDAFYAWAVVFSLSLLLIGVGSLVILANIWLLAGSFSLDTFTPADVLLFLVFILNCMFLGTSFLYAFGSAMYGRSKEGRSDPPDVPPAYYARG